MRLQIEKLVYGGDGLARLAADEAGRRKAVFVPFTLTGEVVEAAPVEEKPGFVRARLDSIHTAAPSRTTPACPYFGECGGCHYQHTSYENQLQIKTAILRETIARISKVEVADVQAHASPPLQYRNRTRVRVQQNAELELGYFRSGTHDFLPVRECPISSPLINRAIAALLDFGSNRIWDAAAEIEFFANQDDSALMLVPLVDPARFSADPLRLSSFAESIRTVLPELARIVVLPRAHRPNSTDAVAAPELDQEIVASSEALASYAGTSLKYRAAGFDYRVSAGSFFQTNRFLSDTLVDLVTANQSGALALDLYAGVGLFSLALAKSFERVIAVEASPRSVADLRANAAPNVKPIAATTEKFLEKKGRRPDTVVVDPPRSGLGKRAVESLARMHAPRLTYVSCNPATLARDLVPLLAAGYRITGTHLVDLFPQTFHIETVMKLEL